MKMYMRLFALMVSTFSVISFVQALFDIGLLSIAREMVDYYRTFTYFFLGMPARLFGLQFPATLMDMWTLSFIGAGAYVGTRNIEAARIFRSHPALTEWNYWKIGLAFILGITGMGLLVLLGAISPSTYVDDLREEPLDLSKGAALNAFYVIAAATAFFVINAFAPSV